MERLGKAAILQLCELFASLVEEEDKFQSSLVHNVERATSMLSFLKSFLQQLNAFLKANGIPEEFQWRLDIQIQSLPSLESVSETSTAGGFLVFLPFQVLDQVVLNGWMALLLKPLKKGIGFCWRMQIFAILLFWIDSILSWNRMEN